jgi:predicted CoA-binding protein
MTVTATKLAVPIKQAAEEFLACKRIAVTGVSRNPATHGSNVVYRRLRERGYEVFAVNPNADTVEGDHAFANLADIPGRVDAVVIGTRPEHDHATIDACVGLGIHHVWMHRPFIGAGSVSTEAAAYARAHNVDVIEGGCPLMFGPTSDPAHCVMRTVGTWMHTVPKDVAQPICSL